MRNKFKNKKAAIAFMLAAMMAVPSISGAKALAADDYDHEIDVFATDEDMEVEVGNITSADDGIEVILSDGYDAKVTAGDITADDDGVYINESFSDNSVVDISTGDITSGDDGVYVEYIEGDNNVVSISTGDITADGIGINVNDLYGEDSVLNISTGSITAIDSGIYVDNDGNGSVEMEVNGSVSRISLEGSSAHLYTDGGKLSLVVNGDIISPSTGLFFDTDSEDGTADVFVEGTIDGGEIGVRLLGDDDFEAENLSLTVWRIIPNDAGEFVTVSDDPDSDMIEELEEKIMYIIKIEQPTEGGTIAVTDKDGNALEKIHNYDVANQGDKVLLKVDTEEGYKITGAYNGVDGEKLELLKDANGDYFVEVPKGGGVYLTAELEKENYDISFYDDDGNLIQTYSLDYGSTITVPNGPAKDGFEFLYWEGSKYYPGDQYTVTGPHTFKAVWKKIEEKSDDTAAPTGTTDNTSKPVASSPATDDATNIVMLFILMMVSASGAVIAANLKKRLNRKED